jgi:DNA-binding XRE family transcriptional regulator
MTICHLMIITICHKMGAMKNHIRELREAAGISSKELYDAIGWEQSRFSHLENCKRKLSYDVAVKLARVLKCSIEDLYEAKDFEQLKLVAPPSYADVLAAISVEAAARGGKKPSEELAKLAAQKVSAWLKPDLEKGNIPSPELIIRTARLLLGSSQSRDSEKNQDH